MSGDPIFSANNIGTLPGGVRLAQNEEVQEELLSFLAAQAACNFAGREIAEINQEFRALGEELKTASEKAKKELYAKFKILTERLINLLYSCEERYLRLEALPPTENYALSKITLNPAALDADLAAFLGVLPLLTPAQRFAVLAVANRQILQPNPNRLEISRHTGRRMIQALHRKPSPENSAQLWQNLQRGMQLFAGLPFHLGSGGNYVKTDGHLSGKGIECISYANILVNLVSGIKNFSPKVGGMTGPDMFVRKPEFVRAGIRPAPVINRLKMDSASADDVVLLLEEYGDFFVTQIYHPDGLPYHIVLVYKDRSDGKFKITEAEIGTRVIYGKDFNSWYEQKKNTFGFLTFNLIDPAKVGTFAFGKSQKFIQYLTADIEKAKQ